MQSTLARRKSSTLSWVASAALRREGRSAVCLSRKVHSWCGGMLESGIGRVHNIAVSTLPATRCRVTFPRASATGTRILPIRGRSECKRHDSCSDGCGPGLSGAARCRRALHNRKGDMACSLGGRSWRVRAFLWVASCCCSPRKVPVRRTIRSRLASPSRRLRRAKAMDWRLWT